MASVPDERPEMQQLEENMADYLAEREHIRTVMGHFGSAPETRREKWLNVCFILLVVGLVVLDIVRYSMQVDLGLPPMISIEIGLFLVSIKLIWMLHQQARVEHFQFWILSAIEYRVNLIGKETRALRDLVLARERPAAPPEKGDEPHVDK